MLLGVTRGVDPLEKQVFDITLRASEFVYTDVEMLLVAKHRTFITNASALALDHI